MVINKKSISKVVVFALAVSVFCSTLSTAKGQNVIYSSFGYNANYAWLKDMNFILDRYNETRTWLDDEMGDMHYLGGLGGSIGFNLSGLFMDMGFHTKYSIKHSKGDPGTGLAQRDFRFKMNTYTFGIGVASPKKGNLVMSSGLSLDLGFYKTSTRLGTPEEIKEKDFAEIQSDIFMGSSFFVQYFITGKRRSGLGLLLRPYIQLPWFSLELDDVNKTINPNTYLSDPEGLKDLPVTVGIMAAISLYVKD